MMEELKKKKKGDSSLYRKCVEHIVGGEVFPFHTGNIAPRFRSLGKELRKKFQGTEICNNLLSVSISIAGEFARSKGRMTCRLPW